MIYSNIKNHYVMFSLSLLCAGASVRVAALWSKTSTVQQSSLSLAAPPAAPLEDAFLEQGVSLREELLQSETLVPSVSILAEALRERRTLEEHPIRVIFEGENQTMEPWILSLKDHESWLLLHSTLLSARFDLDLDALEKDLREAPPPMVPRGSDAQATNVINDGKVLRTSINGVVQAGYALDAHDAARQIADALRDRRDELVLPVTREGGGLFLRLPDGQTKHLMLIASGKSDFAKSPEPRVWNIRKALSERLSGVVIPPDATFSFNDTLDVPITLKKGWKEALGLFGGGAAMTPGGGICQVATTAYRAALLAGLPILKRRGHSLFVSYYEKHGVGMDATIFPGVQDLTFKNDTGHELVLQAFTEGDEAFLNIYGVPDGRRVTLQGPYFSVTKPRDPLVRPLALNEIAWVQRITYADGSTAEKPFISTYQKGIPRKVKTEHAQMQTIDVTHAAAPQTTPAAMVTN